MDVSYRCYSLVQLCQSQQPWCRHFQVQQLRLDTTSNKEKSNCVTGLEHQMT